MIWVILTGRDILLLDTERTIMAAAAPLQDLDTCVLSASNLARGYIEGGGNTLDVAPSVPPECANDVLAIARYDYLAQDPSGTLLTPIRQKEYDNALSHLRDIAKQVATVTQGAATTVTTGQWGSISRLPMRTETALSPPP